MSFLKRYNRRTLLKHTVSAATAALVAPIGGLTAMATGGTSQRALVCVFMSGGGDSNNIVVPLNGKTRNDYEAERGVFGLASTEALPFAEGVNNAYGESTEWGLHPGLTGLANAAARDELAVIANMGTLVRPTVKADYLRDPAFFRPERLFSHSDQVAQMHSGMPQMASASGWMGRLVDHLTRPSDALLPMGISLSGNALILTGDTSAPASLQANYNLTPRAISGAEREARTDAFKWLLGNNNNMLQARANSAMLDALTLGEQLAVARTSGPSSSVPFPNTAIGRQLRDVAELIRLQRYNYLPSQPQVFFVNHGGFDNHSNQGPILATRLSQLDDALTAFSAEMAAIEKTRDVTTFTLSDFGRTFEVNSNAGTDHAWGYHGLVVGGAVMPGLHGHFPLLQKNGDDSTDRRGRWIPTTALDEVGAHLAGWMGLSESHLPDIFPNMGRFEHNLAFLSS